MEYTQAAAANIRAEMARQRISGRELARRLDMNPTSLARRVAGDVDISLDELAHIADALRVTVAALLPTPTEKASA